MNLTIFRQLAERLGITSPEAQKEPKEALRQAYADGYFAGFEDTYNDGYADGYFAGFDDGYDDGYNNALDAGGWR